jgi:repressor of nif and glnA expression
MAWDPPAARDGSLLDELRRMRREIDDLKRNLADVTRSSVAGVSGSSGSQLLSVRIDPDTTGVAILTGTFPVTGSIAGIPLGTLAARDPNDSTVAVLTVTQT